MNRLFIGEDTHQLLDFQTLRIPFKQAARWLPMLRNEYFSEIRVQLPQTAINIKQLKFLMSITRIIQKNGQVIVIWGHESNKILVLELANNLGFNESRTQENVICFIRNTISTTENGKQYKKLAIGFKGLLDQQQEEQEDEQELLANENLKLQNPNKDLKCVDKPRACANCSCGRKDNEQYQTMLYRPILSKQELIESVNKGIPVSGCGKCYLGDSFRCGSCPYQGLPAFKPGDKLKLAEQGNVIVKQANLPVEQSVNITNTGKVTISI